MNYPQLLAPVRTFLHCHTPQCWIDKARAPENLPLLLTDHMICELKAAQTAMLLICKPFLAGARYSLRQNYRQSLCPWIDS